MHCLSTLVLLASLFVEPVRCQPVFSDASRFYVAGLSLVRRVAVLAIPLRYPHKLIIRIIQVVRELKNGRECS